MLKPGSTTCLIVLMAGALLCPFRSGMAQTPANVLPTDAGRAVSTAFLVELANPARTMTKYRVGLVVPEVGIGLMISPKGAPLAVEYIAGADQTRGPGSRALVDAAINQIRKQQPGDFRFRVVRKILTAQNCPKMVAGFTDFYQELEKALAAPINLADRPPSPEGRAATHGDYRIQVTVYSAVLSLDHMAEMLHPLAPVINLLMPVVRDCADGVAPSAQQNYSFSYDQANLQPDPGKK